MNKRELNGYTVIPVAFSESSRSDHCIYLKEHSVREKCPDKPADKTLFILGVPPYATRESLKRIFSECGPVSDVHFHAKPTCSAPARETSKFFKDHPVIEGFKVAYVVFENSLGVSRALSLDPSTPLVLSTKETPVLCGMEKWCREYNASLVERGELQAEIDAFLADYDQRLLQEADDLKASQQPDDQGWITVLNKGRKPGFSRKESTGKRILEKEKLKRSKKQLVNFYRFQIRESKMNHLTKLREKFEEDKKKIALLKQTRKFKPY